MTSLEEAPTTGDTLRKAYLTIERMQRQLAEQQKARYEPIAVIGMGCRFPGGAVDADSYWRLLSEGVDAVREIPADRWDVDAYYDEQAQQPGKMRTRWGGFLDRVDEFDYEFFGISRREALAMDPQQRLALEVSWQALENAGQAPAALAGSQTGVYLGVCSYDFASLNFQDPLDLTAYASTGTAHSVVAGRISYLLDLHGPSLAIDSACSSSLVAVQMAIQSLRAGECDLALAGGVNVVMSPLPSIAFSQFPGMVSADGRCKTFDAAANGYVRSEGCGIIVLKRLSDAVRDGDQVLGLLRGGAVNQDGRSSGVTAPNGLAQQEVLRSALRSSGVRPEQVGYIEAHGTGTTLGDPIEVEALAEVFGRPEGAPVYLGSAKTNIGHPEAAAGIAGLIKVLLSLSRGAIPPNVHFQKLNPHLSFDGTTFAVPTELTQWPATGGRRIAGVSSFGFSGTNAHVILEQAPEPAAVPDEAADEPDRALSVLALSAKSEAALLRLAAGYVKRYEGGSKEPAADLCYSANTGRAHFRHRLAAVGRSTADITDRLRDFVDGLPGDEPAVGSGAGADVVFLFAGQGPQRPGMAEQLYRTQPTFRKVLDTCDEVLRPVMDVPLLSVLYPSEPADQLIYQTTYSQPALFAVEYALAQLWRSWGVEPVAVLGHSFGEYVAACVAGAMSLEDGLRLVAARGRLMQELATTGAMAAVYAPEQQVIEALAGYDGQLSIAAVNGPANTAVSGEQAALAALCADFDAAGVKTKQLRITTASHSALVEPILDGLREAAARVSFSSPRISLLSNLSGRLWEWGSAPDPEYWAKHARQPVRFAENVATLLDMGHHNFLEVGPAPTLLGLVGDLPGLASEALLLPSLRPNQDDTQVMLSTLTQLYVHGAEIDWRGFDRDYRRRKVTVPTYPFEPTRCWQQPRQRPAAVGQASGPAAGQERQAEQYADEDLLYRLQWQPTERPATPPSAVTDRDWLILADTGSVGRQLATELRQHGARFVLVNRGAQYRYDGGEEAMVGTDSVRSDLRRLVRELTGRSTAPLAVVHLWSLDEPSGVAGSVPDALAGQRSGCLSAIGTAQALADGEGAAKVRLWLVTRGAVQPEGTDGAGLSVGQSTLWGLGRSLQQEHQALWGGLLDLDPAADPAASAQQLLAEVERTDSEDQVALRQDRRYVARLVREQLPEQPAGPLWRPDASYLITGGLGGVGIAVARSMVGAGARRLVLLGRTALPARRDWSGLPAEHPAAAKVAAVRELEALGASVLPVSVDVCDAQAMQAFLDRFDSEGWPAIRGIVHAAGEGDMAPLVELDAAALEGHLGAKSMGALVLDRIFADRPLDFFVLCSSASSVLSSPFVASYAAANAYLDALAQARRNAGKPGLSINWGIWAETGLAERGAEATGGLGRGMGTLAPSQAAGLLHKLLPYQGAQVAVLPVDWSDWGRRYQEVSGSPLLSELLGGQSAARPRRRAQRVSLLPSRQDLLAVPAAERLGVLIDKLLLSVAATLEADATSLRADQALFDLGLDSLMAVELRNEVESRLEIRLPISVLLEGTSVQGLAEQILARLSGEADQAAAPIGRRERLADVTARLLAQVEQSPEALSQSGTGGVGHG